MTSFPCPDFGALVELTELRLQTTTMTGVSLSALACLGDLPKLAHLDVSTTGVGGQLPPEWGAIGSLQRLFVRDNANMASTLPPEYGDLAHLVELNLDCGGTPLNYLTGTIPPSYERLSALEKLVLRNSALTSPLPDLGRLVALDTLELSGLYINEPFPTSWVNLDQMQYFDCTAPRDIGFSGSIPDSLVWPSLISFRLSDHDALGGTLPQGLISATLTTLDVAGDSLTGELPDLTGAVLSAIDLTGNAFETNTFNDFVGFWTGYGGTILLDYVTNTVYCNVNGRSAPQVDTGAGECACPPGFAQSEHPCTTCATGYWGGDCLPCPGTLEANTCFGLGACDASGHCPEQLTAVHPDTFDSTADEHAVLFMGAAADTPSSTQHVVFTTAADCSGTPAGVAGVLDAASITLSGRFTAEPHRCCLSVDGGAADSFMLQPSLFFTPKLTAHADDARDTEIEHGWLVELFDDRDAAAGEYLSTFAGSLVTADNIHWDFGAGSPPLGDVGEDHFSLRASARVVFPYFGVTDEYTLRVHADNGVRVYVDGVLVADAWVDAPTARDVTASAITVASEADTMHDVVVEQFHSTGTDHKFHLRWFTDNTFPGERDIDPQFVFRPFGDAAHFDGSTDGYYAVSGVGWPEWGWAARAWVYPFSSPTQENTLFSLSDESTASLVEVSLHTNSDDKGLTIAVAGSVLHTQVALREDSWSHVSVSVDHSDGRVRVHVDGLLRFDRVWSVVDNAPLSTTGTTVLAVGARLTNVAPDADSVDALASLDAKLHMLTLAESGVDLALGEPWAAADEDKIVLHVRFGAHEHEQEYLPGGELPYVSGSPYGEHAGALAYHGTSVLAHSLPPVLGSVDRALHLDGSPHVLYQVRDPRGIDLMGGAAVSLRFAVSEEMEAGTPATLLSITAQAQTSASAAILLLEVAFDFPDKVHFTMWGQEASWTLTGVSTDEWNTLVCRGLVDNANNNNVECVLNGEASGVSALTKGAQPDPATHRIALTLGHRVDSGWAVDRSRAFVGALDDVRVHMINEGADMGNLAAHACRAATFDGLIAHYTFDLGDSDASLATIVPDRSEMRNDLRAHAHASSTPDRALRAPTMCPNTDFGCAAQFDSGQHDYERRMLATDFSVGALTDFTLTFWVRLDHMPGAVALNVLDYWVDASNRILVQYDSDTYLNVFINVVNVKLNVGTLSYDEWYFVYFSWRNSDGHVEYRVWNDAGVQMTDTGRTMCSGCTVSGAGLSTQTTPRFSVGARSYDSVRFNDFMRGALDSVRLFPSYGAVPSGAALDYYACHEGSAPGSAPQLEYLFDECEVAPEYADTSGNSVHLRTLVDTVLHVESAPYNAKCSGALSQRGGVLYTLDGLSHFYGAYKPVGHHTGGDFTLTFWFNFMEVGLGDVTLYTWQVNDDVLNAFQVHFKNTANTLVVRFLNTQATLALGTTLARNTWYHIGLQQSGTTISSYLDGALTDSVAFTASTTTPGANDAYLALGHVLATRGVAVSDGQKNAHFWGYMDEVRLWTSSTPSVSADFCAATPAGSPALWYDFDQLTHEAAVVVDRSGNGVHLQPMEHLATPAAPQPRVAAPPLSSWMTSLAASRSLSAHDVYLAQCWDTYCSGRGGCCPANCGSSGAHECVDGRCVCAACSFGLTCGSLDAECAGDVVPGAPVFSLVGGEANQVVQVDVPSGVSATNALPTLMLVAGDMCASSEVDAQPVWADAEVLLAAPDLDDARLLDLNGDGLHDLVALHSSGTPELVAYAQSDVGVLDTANGVTVASGAGITTMVVLDENADGQDDVYYPCNAQTCLATNTGDGATWNARSVLAVEWSDALATDLNNDGYADVVQHQSGNANNFYAVRNDRGSFSSFVVQSAFELAGDAFSTMCVGRVLGTAYVDLYAIRSDNTLNLITFNDDANKGRQYAGTASVLSSIVPQVTVGGSHGIACGQLNRDIYCDLVVWNPGASAAVHLTDATKRHSANWGTTEGFHTSVAFTLDSDVRRCFVVDGAHEGDAQAIACYFAHASNDVVPSLRLFDTPTTEVGLFSSPWTYEEVLTGVAHVNFVQRVDVDGDGLRDLFVSAAGSHVALWIPSRYRHASQIESHSQSSAALNGARLFAGAVPPQPVIETAARVCVSPDFGTTWAEQRVDIEVVGANGVVREAEPARVSPSSPVTMSSPGAYGGGGNPARVVSFVAAGGVCDASVATLLPAPDVVEDRTTSVADVTPLDVQGTLEVGFVYHENNEMRVHVHVLGAESDTPLAHTIPSLSAVNALAVAPTEQGGRMVVAAVTDGGVQKLWSLYLGTYGVGTVRSKPIDSGTPYTSLTSEPTGNGAMFAANSGVISSAQGPWYGSWSNIVTATTSITSAGVVGCNFDGDARAEVVYGDGSDVCFAYNSGGWQVSCVHTFGSTVLSVAVADLDGDTMDDIVAANDADVVWLRNLGSLTFDTARPVTTADGAPLSRMLTCVDLNLDGTQDVVVGLDVGSVLTTAVFLNDGTGTFAASPDATDTHATTYDGLASYVDPVTHTPVVLVSTDTTVERFEPALNTGVEGGEMTATFVSETAVSTSAPAGHDVVYDMCLSRDSGATWTKQDGIQVTVRDLASVVTGASPASFEETETPLIHLTGAHASPETRFSLVESTDACTSSVELVSLGTLFAVEGGVQKAVRGQLNNAGAGDLVLFGDGLYGVQWHDGSDLGGTSAPVTDIAKFALSSVDVGDVVGSADKDILFASARYNQVGYFENGGSAASWTYGVLLSVSAYVEQPTVVLQPTGSSAILVGDLHGVYLFQNADGYTTPTVVTAAERVMSIAVDDVDAAIDVDVAVVSNGDSTLRVVENLGGGTFTVHVVATDLQNPTKVHIADVDGTGDLDLLLLEYSSHRMSWWSNAGSFTFAKHAIDERALGAADVMMLGTDRLVAALAEPPYLRVYQNEGPDASLGVGDPLGWSQRDVETESPVEHLVPLTSTSFLAIHADGAVEQFADAPASFGDTLYDDAEGVPLASRVAVGYDAVMDVCYSEDGGSTWAKQSASMVVAAENDGSAPVFGDPHFGGLHGGWYDFHGEPGKVYNLVSDTNVQLNARFVHIDEGELTGYFMSALGLKLGPRTRIRYDRSGNVTITPLVLDRAHTGRGQRALIEGGGSIEWDAQDLTITYDVYRITLRRFAGKSEAERANVATHHVAYRLWFDRERMVRESRWATWAPHGVHGQTGRVEGVVVGRGTQGEGVIEGTPADYEVAGGDLFGDAFTFNQFAPKQRVAVPASPSAAFVDATSGYGV